MVVLSMPKMVPARSMRRGTRITATLLAKVHLGIFIAGALAVFAPDNSKAATTRGVGIDSPFLDAIVQNTPGYSQGYPLGVPRHYNWCGGSYQPNPSPPADFTSVTGSGQIYRKVGTDPNTQIQGKIEITRAVTYVRLKSTKQWILVQDQVETPLDGAYFQADFSRSKPTVPMDVSEGAPGKISIDPPPSDHNAHFWFTGRGTYPAGDVDAVYMQVAVRTTEPETGLIANLGAEWWRDAASSFEPGADNSAGTGMSNWVELSPKWTTLRLFSLPTSDFEKSPPPPVAQPSQVKIPVALKRSTSAGPSPCLKFREPGSSGLSPLNGNALQN